MPVKTVLIGDTAVGKSCLYDRLSIQDYDDGDRLPTIGGSFRSVKIRSRDGTQIEFALWDTAGQELYRTLVPMYFDRAVILIVVYSIIDLPTFEHVPEWIALAQERVDHRAKILLVGNKADLDEERVVPLERLTEMEKQIKAYSALEISAKVAIGIDDLKQILADAAYDFQFDGRVSDTLTFTDGADLGDPPDNRSCC
jgi:small GTP-binding protein